MVQVADRYNHANKMSVNSDGTINVKGIGCNREYGHYIVRGILVYKLDENKKLCTYLSLNREYITGDGGTDELDVETNATGQVVETNAIG